jgi:hypothetical protein
MSRHDGFRGQSGGVCNGREVGAGIPTIYDRYLDDPSCFPWLPLI